MRGRLLYPISEISRTLLEQHYGLESAGSAARLSCGPACRAVDALETRRLAKYPLDQRGVVHSHAGCCRRDGCRRGLCRCAARDKLAGSALCPACSWIRRDEPCIHVAASEGVTVAWWVKAIQPGTRVSDLHNVWAFGTSFMSAALAGKSFNLVAVAGILSRHCSDQRAATAARSHHRYLAAHSARGSRHPGRG